MSKKYEVTVDGETEEVTTKKEVTEIVLDTVLEGGEHEVAVEVVDTKAEEAAEGDSNEDNPTATVGGGVADAQGVPHIR